MPPGGSACPEARSAVEVIGPEILVASAARPRHLAPRLPPVSLLRNKSASPGKGIGADDLDAVSTGPGAHRRGGRHWSKRVALGVLVSLVALVAVRASVATVVRIHGDGMAPTLLDGDAALLLRTGWELEIGDIVIYDPELTMPAEAATRVAAPIERANGEMDLGAADEPDISPPMVNTAVVEREELDHGWNRVQRKTLGDGSHPGGLRVGRVLAMPGDRITFGHESGALGLAINGTPIVQKQGEVALVRLLAPSSSSSGDKAGDKARDKATPSKQETVLRERATRYEMYGAHRWTVLPAHAPIEWTGLGLPSLHDGPIEIVADGYLIIADHRDDGACCDSRALGLIPREAIRGELVARMRAKHDPNDDPDDDRVQADHGGNGPAQTSTLDGTRSADGWQWLP